MEATFQFKCGKSLNYIFKETNGMKKVFRFIKTVMSFKNQLLLLNAIFNNFVANSKDKRQSSSSFPLENFSLSIKDLSFLVKPICILSPIYCLSILVVNSLNSFSIAFFYYYNPSPSMFPINSGVSCLSNPSLIYILDIY